MLTLTGACAAVTVFSILESSVVGILDKNKYLVEWLNQCIAKLYNRNTGVQPEDDGIATSEPWRSGVCCYASHSATVRPCGNAHANNPCSNHALAVTGCLVGKPGRYFSFYVFYPMFLFPPIYWYGYQCFLFSRNNVKVTPKIICFHHLKNIFSGSKYPKKIVI